MQRSKTGSFELIKNMNTSYILDAIRENGRISRADIARKTGLTPATVTNITAELIDLRLIKETTRGVSSGGRKPVMLSINPSACYFAGVYIGSTRLEVGIADVEAEILLHKSKPIPEGSSHAGVLGDAVAMIRSAVKDSGVDCISGVGVSMHGLVSSRNGVLVFAPNYGWENVPVAELLAGEFGIPVVTENDVRAMSLAESWCGGARNLKNYVYLYIGSGIGGSIVLDGEIYKGEGGFAGEFGHNTIEPDGPLCSCGNTGCLQAVASEKTMIKKYCLRRGISSDFDFYDLMQAYRDGDQAANDVIYQSLRYIGMEVGNLINALSPSLIVISGRITELGDLAAAVINEEVSRRCMKNSQNQTRVAFSKLGDEAQLKGAAACVIREMLAIPKKFLCVD